MGDTVKKTDFKLSPGLSPFKEEPGPTLPSCHTSESEWLSPRIRGHSFPSHWSLRKWGSIWEALRNTPYISWSLPHVLLGTTLFEHSFCPWDWEIGSRLITHSLLPIAHKSCHSPKWTQNIGSGNAAKSLSFPTSTPALCRLTESTGAALGLYLVTLPWRFVTYLGVKKPKQTTHKKNPKHTKTNKPKTTAQIPHSKTLLLSLEGEKDEEGRESQDSKWKIVERMST